MPGQDESKRIEPISSSEPRRRIDLDPTDTEATAKAKFDEAMQKADTSKVERRVVTPEPSVIQQSPMDAAKISQQDAIKVAPLQKDMLAQASDIRSRIDRPRAILREIEQLPADQKIKDRVLSSPELSKSIGHVERSLQEAVQLTTGVEVGSVAKVDKPPLKKFLTYLTESDKRLTTIMNEIQALDMQKQKLTPERLLAIQVKMGFVQQQLEFFTTALSKSLDSIKTLMNVQI
jgi:hypothetical protein